VISFENVIWWFVCWILVTSRIVLGF
jgi:hypothetical protein